MQGNRGAAARGGLLNKRLNCFVAARPKGQSGPEENVHDSD
jgi:hypothetical protein